MALSLSGITSTAGADFTTGNTLTFTNGVTLSGSTLTIPAGVTTFAIGVPTVADNIDEPNETYSIGVADISAVGTIIDNNNAPTISNISSVGQAEGTTLAHTVTLSNASSVATTYAFSIGNSVSCTATATSGIDYNATPIFSNGVTLSNGTLTVPAGVTSFTINVASVQDSIFETNESYYITVDGFIAQGTINNDDAAPTVAVSSFSIAEVNGFALFTVSLSNASSTAVSVNLGFGNGSVNPTATSGPSSASVNTDYGNNTLMQVSTYGGATWSAAGTNAATFAAGSTSVLVRTPIYANNPTTPADAPKEDFTLTATSSTGTTSKISAVGTAIIIDRAITSTNTPAAVTEGANIVHTFTTTAFASATSYSFSIGGTATSGADYNTTPTFTTTAGTGTVTLSGGVLTVPGTVTGFSVTVCCYH